MFLFDTLLGILCLTPTTTSIWCLFNLCAYLLCKNYEISYYLIPVIAYIIFGVHEFLAFFVVKEGLFPSDERVRRIYEWATIYLDRVKNVDLTEGFFNCDYQKSLEQATADKYDEIIRLLGLSPGNNVLDVGCGQGDFLLHLKSKGINGVGLTISPNQRDLGISRGLDVRCLDFRQPLPKELQGKFDAVIFMGCLEHFVQGYMKRADTLAVYNRAFRSAKEAISPFSKVKRVFSTTLHKNLKYRKWQLSDYFYAYLLHGFYSGSYPLEGHLQIACQPYFNTIYQYDASIDYQMSSIVSTNHFGLCKIDWTTPRLIYTLARFLVNPFELFTWLYYKCEAWMWQFGGRAIVPVNQRPCLTFWYVYQAVDKSEENSQYVET